MIEALYVILGLIFYVLMVVVAIGGAALAAFICVNVYALIKPAIKPLIEKWEDWFFRRIDD